MTNDRKRDTTNASMDRLLTLFKVPMTTQAEGSKAYYQKVLGSICDELMNDYDLVIGTDGDRSNDSDQDNTSNQQQQQQRRYALLEAEVYFKTSPEYQHDDPYTHAHPLQYQNGAWYFHHVGHSNGFRGGSRKGMDVTLVGVDETTGTIKDLAHAGGGGGILIRAVQCTTTNKVIEGPSLLMDLILKSLGHTSIKAMVADRFKKGNAQPCDDKTSGLFFAPKIQQQQHHHHHEALVASCRIGLGLKNHTPSLEKRLAYVCRSYRFVAQPRLLKKGKIWIILEMIQKQQQQQQQQRGANRSKRQKGSSSLSLSSTSSSSSSLVALFNIKDSMAKSYEEQVVFGRTNAVEILKSCRQGSLSDIVQGNSGWKLQVMSAILWWENEISNGNHVDLGVE